VQATCTQRIDGLALVPQILDELRRKAEDNIDAIRRTKKMVAEPLKRTEMAEYRETLGSSSLLRWRRHNRYRGSVEIAMIVSSPAPLCANSVNRPTRKVGFGKLLSPKGQGRSTRPEPRLHAI
jgi:hypothetical protein